MIYGVTASEDAGDIIKNALALHGMAKGTPEERTFHRSRVKNATHLIVLSRTDGVIFAPVKWSGAKDNSIAAYPRNKRPTTDHFKPVAIRCGFVPIHWNDPRFQQVYDEYVTYCRSFDFFHSVTLERRTFYLQDRDHWHPDEIDEGETYVEGTRRSIYVNAYERDRSARDACIAHHGLSCAVCGMDFEEFYGDIGKGYIHVHHKIPLASIGMVYSVDPVKDLVPVCPNCHAMLHRQSRVLEIEELRQRVRIARGVGRLP